MATLGFQHMFAMFGATILVPILTGLSVQVTLLGMGVGTLIFHFFAKGKVPVFLGSSFAFLVGIRVITNPDNGLFAGTGMEQAEKLAYATGAIAVAGLMYVVVAILVKIIGPQKFMKFLPPVVTAPIVMIIGLMLAPFAIDQSRNNLLLAAITLLIIMVAAVKGKGLAKIIPILIGIAGAYAIAWIMQGFGMTNPDGSAVVAIETAGRNLVGLPPFMAPKFSLAAILIMLPFSIATIAEHVADMVALSKIGEKELNGVTLMEEPGLFRTLTGDGLATVFSGLIGGPASTTYSENVGVVALTKVFNSRVVQLAAIYATVLAFSPLFAAVVYSIPTAIIGGASFLLYGMIASVGLRNLVDNRVDMSATKNVIIVAVMCVLAFGLRFGPDITFAMGDVNIPVSRLGMPIALILGVILNIIIKDAPAADTEEQ
jgi:uracil permease